MKTSSIKKSKAAKEETQRTAANFKRLRVFRGWTRYQMAEMGGISYGLVSNIETGRKGLGKRGRIKWAKIFGVDTSEFLQPINSSEFDLELARLKEQLIRYPIEKLRRLNQAIPYFFGEGDANHADSKEPHRKGHP